MEAFKLALETNGLFDLGWIDKKFTWSNRHDDDIFTMERLDRAIANRRWISEFGNQGVEILVTSRSDHQALLFNTNRHDGYRRH